MTGEMKKKRNIYRISSWGLILLIGIVFSCENYFEYEPVSLFSNENVFNNADYTRQAVLGIYQLMTRDEGYSKRLSMYYGVDTDIAMCSGSFDNGRRGIARYGANSGNTEIEQPWRNLYTAIERANICIANIPESKVYQDGTAAQQEEMDRLLGEALTLRAIFYYELARNWGDVPFKTEPSKAGDEFSLPKTDRDLIYDHIIDDLKEASDLVPWRSQVTSDERLTKGAVLGFLARISLARGGYSLRREGTMQRSSDYLEYYQIARDACKTVMESKEHALNPVYADVFKNHCKRILDTKYGESMYEVGMGIYRSGEVGYYIGNRIDAASRYGKGDGGVRAIPTYYLSFDSLDVRRDHTVALYEIDAGNIRLHRKFEEIFIGKWRREWIEPLLPGSDKYNGVNWVMLRYSDVLLMFAEAENELNQGPTAEAMEAFRMVRERAFPGNTDKMPPIPSDYQGFFNGLVKERAWEFGGECIRKFDLIRWNLLDQKLKEMRENLTKLMEKEAPYEDVPDEVVWRNEGEQIEYLNLHHHLDSAAIADRDSIYWPNVTAWVDQLTEEYILSIAEFFEPNRKELLPIHQNIVDANTNLQNDFGY
jgi:hypothetical protein